MVNIPPPPDPHGNPADLLERATRLRGLALSLADDEMGKRLLDYAKALEAKAGAIAG
jgi:hypothetical protein